MTARDDYPWLARWADTGTLEAKKVLAELDELRAYKASEEAMWDVQLPDDAA